MSFVIRFVSKQTQKHTRSLALTC